MKSKGFPPVSRDLLEYLQAAFPNNLPTSVISESDLAVLLGQQKVINHLQMVMNSQLREMEQN